ncbi:MAG: dihydroorotate dehydrogenase electron transfer subunit [Defluviitaleaceae bacterium]|nr:dihydroorotate dehydrogenase electron transfer subunit [Defluviitaleaceae bacterium]
MKIHETATIKAHTNKSGYYNLSLYAPQIAKAAKPGQFVMVYLDKGEHLLPRPISIYDIKEDIVTLVYVEAGAGTKAMTKWPIGHSIKILGPLGNGFTIDLLGERERVAVIGGGVGAAPLFFLTEALYRQRAKVDIYLGFRDDASSLVKPFEGFADNIKVDIGGFVTDMLPPNPGYSAILTCGPIPMMKAVADYAHSHNMPCQVSLEERMACGLGACKGCVVKTMVGYQLCCDDGPVWDSKEVKWDA